MADFVMPKPLAAAIPACAFCRAAFLQLRHRVIGGTIGAS